MKVSNSVVSQPQDTETQSCEGTSATAAPKEASTADTVKTAAKVTGVAVDQFVKYASATQGLEKFAGPGAKVVTGLKVLGAGITAAQQYEKAASTSTAGKLLEAGLAGGAAFAVSKTPLGVVDLALGGEISKGMAASTSAVVGLADAAITGDTSGLERYQDRARAGELGAVARAHVALGDASVEAADYWEKRGIEGTLEDFKAALLDD